MWHAVEEAAKPNDRSHKPSLPIVKYTMKAWPALPCTVLRDPCVIIIIIIYLIRQGYTKK